jgi:hypothetical protein
MYCHRDRVARRQERRPIDRVHLVVERVLVRRFERRAPREHAHRHARPQARAKTVLERAFEMHAAAIRAHVAQPELTQLVAERGLGPLGCGGEEVHRR